MSGTFVSTDATGPAFALVVLLASAPALAAQTQLIAGTRSSCGECRIEAQRLLTFTPDSSAAGLPYPYSVDRDSRGLYYAVSRRQPDRVTVFDSTGRFLRHLGTDGSLQGAFRFVWAVRVGQADSVFVLDTDRKHIQVLSPDWQPARSFPMPSLVQSFHWLGSDSLVANVLLYPAEQNRQPLHVYSATNGVHARSLGDVMPTRLCTAESYWWRPFAVGPDGMVWAARRSAYVVELWDVPTGALLKRLARRVGWFPPADTLNQVVTPQHPPQSRVVAIRVDAAGLLWMTSLVADPRWRTAVSPPRQTPRGISYVISDMERYFDTVIEVIDPKSEKLVAHKRFDFFVATSVDSDVVTFHEREKGRGVAELWRLELRGRDARASVR